MAQTNTRCALWCGGRACGKENWLNWLSDPRHPNAVHGLWSNWIYYNCAADEPLARMEHAVVLAMQRPSTRIIREFDLLSVFKDEGITAIFNLQEPGEHAYCGDGIEKASGFSYLPEVWMEAGIAHYNFGWPDMTVPDCQLVLSIVQVMAHEVDSGGKIAVHCHAGLGRTGLAIACYLVYHRKMDPDDAIRAVRSRRPKCIQTAKQQKFISQFRDYLSRVLVIFPNVAALRPSVTDVYTTFAEQIENQSLYLRGLEHRMLKNVPKIVFICVGRLRMIFRGKLDASVELDDGSAESINNDDISDWLVTHPRKASLRSAKSIAHQITHFQFDERLDWECCRLMLLANDGNYSEIDASESSVLLTNLVLHWLCSLKEPLLSPSLIEAVADCDSDVLTVVDRFDRAVFTTLNVLVEIFREMPDQPYRHEAIYRFAMLLTPQRKDPIPQDISTLEHHVQPHARSVSDDAHARSVSSSDAAANGHTPHQRRSLTPDPTSRHNSGNQELEDGDDDGRGRSASKPSHVWDVVKFLRLLIAEYVVVDGTHSVRRQRTNAVEHR